MNVISTIITFVLLLGVIVLVHEFGHYVAARLMGVRVEIFSFGFGKRIFGKKIGETDFRVSPIPLGGYIKMAGEDEYDPKNLKPYEFQAKNRGQKIFILFMGPAMNLLLSFLIYTALNISGVEMEAYKYNPPLVNYVVAESPAEKAGIQKGDLIRSIEGQPIPDWKELEITIGSNPDQEVPVEFEREGELLKTTLKIGTTSRYNLGDAGIHWGYKTQVISFTEDSPALKAGLKEGDVFLAVDNKPLNYFEFHDKIANNAEKPLLFKIKRGEEQLEFNIVPRKVYCLESEVLTDEKEIKKRLEELESALPELKFAAPSVKWKYYKIVSENIDSSSQGHKYRGMSGLTSTFYVREKGIIGVEMAPYSPIIKTRYGLFAAMGKSIHDIVDLTSRVFGLLKKMIVGKMSPKTLSGPIEIAKISRKALASGLPNFFWLIAFISLQLGIINLFPIPALDGGHLMIYSIETIIRKDFSQKVKNILMNIGFLILIALMAFVILNDIAKTLPDGWNSLLSWLPF